MKAIDLEMLGAEIKHSVDVKGNEFMHIGWISQLPEYAMVTLNTLFRHTKTMSKRKICMCLYNDNYKDILEATKR